jgi:uncharacterized protein YjiS (DUF1127 family)
MTGGCCREFETAIAEAPHDARGRGLVSAYRRLAGVVHTWRDRARTRRELALIEPWVRKDLGCSSYDLRVEIEKPFWRD